MKTGRIVNGISSMQDVADLFAAEASIPPLMHDSLFHKPPLPSKHHIKSLTSCLCVSTFQCVDGEEALQKLATIKAEEGA